MKIKMFTLYLLSIIIIFDSAIGQEKKRSVLNAGGNYQENNGYSLSWSFGSGTPVSTLTVSDYFLTQGFQQPQHSLYTNKAPVDIILSDNMLTEGSPKGTVIGFFTTIDPNEDDNHNYDILTDDGDYSFFSITDSLLLIETITDFESKSEYQIKVK